MTTYTHKDKELTHPMKIKGWLNQQEQDILWRLAQGRKTIVEIGALYGRSTAVLAQHADLLFSVDHQLGSVTDVVDSPLERYIQFLRNMVGIGKLGVNVVPMLMSSQDANTYLAETKIDMVWIDASHDFESVIFDLHLWATMVMINGGVVCGYDWNWIGVETAVYRYCEKNPYYVENIDSHIWRLHND